MRVLPGSVKPPFYKVHPKGLEIILQEPLPKRKADFLPASAPSSTSFVPPLSGHSTKCVLKKIKGFSCSLQATLFTSLGLFPVPGALPANTYGFSILQNLGENWYW